jgi:hypothetical protein
MTPNPTARPFIVGALFFLTLIAAGPGRVSATGGGRHAVTSSSRSTGRVLDVRSTSETLRSSASGVKGL